MLRRATARASDDRALPLRFDGQQAGDYLNAAVTMDYTKLHDVAAVPEASSFSCINRLGT